MADTTPSTTLKLGAENAKRLKDLEAELANAEKGLQTMKSLGIDVKDLEDKLSWAKNVRNTLLKEFV